MTSLRKFVTLVSLLLAISFLSHANDTATLTGTVLFSKRVQQADPFGLNDAPKPIDDPAARGLLNAVVYLEAHGAVPTPLHTDRQVATIHMDQRGFRFVPQVMVVRAGQDFTFGNNDSSDHNIRGNSGEAKNIFNIIMRPGKTYTKQFVPQESDAPVKLACDFHPSMQAWVYVINHDRHAVTDKDGRFQIPNIAPGEYTLHIIQPLTRLRTQATLTLAPGQTHTLKTTFGLKDRYYQGKPPVQIDTK